jgi:hypothetical protein
MGRHLERIEATRKGPSPSPAARSLHYAIDQVDQAMAGYPTYYRINCAHPRHLDSALADAGLSRDRVYGISRPSATPACREAVNGHLTSASHGSSGLVPSQ